MRLLCLTIVALCLTSFALAQESDGILGIWMVQKGDAQIEITRADDGGLNGTIIWLQTPLYESGDAEAGKIKHDRKNPEPERRADELIGLKILRGFQTNSENVWKDGTIYDPASGKTYKCKLTLKENVLEVRGFIGISLLGRTEVWTRKPGAK